jgi:beta-lactamase class A
MTVKRIKLFFYFCVFGIGVYFLFHRFVTNKAFSSTEVISPISASPMHTQTSTPTLKPTPTPTAPLQQNPLRDVVTSAMDGTTGTYGIAIKNLKTHESYYSNGNMVFDTGSLYKLWVMAIVYKQIQNGQLTEDQILRQDIPTLNQEFGIDPSYAELSEGTITLTVHDALYQMITISHNYSAMLLTEKVGLSSLATFLTEYGFTQSKVGINGDNPTSTASDIALFFEKLYNGDFANEQYTKEMIDMLKDQQLSGGIPKYLPTQTEVANKTGDIDFFKHDGGIVFTNKGDYILVVLSQSDSPPDAQERIAILSKAIFYYFTLSTQSNSPR